MAKSAFDVLSWGPPRPRLDSSRESFKIGRPEPLCTRSSPTRQAPRQSVQFWATLGAPRLILIPGFWPGAGNRRFRGLNGPLLSPKAGRRADFGAFPAAVRPKSGPEGRFPALKHYCVYCALGTPWRKTTRSQCWGCELPGLARRCRSTGRSICVPKRPQEDQ